jgi:type IV fimbrial biogenesis protein FimT
MTRAGPPTTILDRTGSMVIRQQRSRCMRAMSKESRDPHTARARGREAGFSLIELMFTTSMMGIVLAIAVPSFARLNADIRTRSTAEQLAGALRLAQISAVTRNRPVAFVLTNTAPGADAQAAANGRNWLVKSLPSAPAGPGAAGTDLIQVATVAQQNRVTLTGPARVCFDALGMQVATPDASGGTATACAQPGSDGVGATSYLVSRIGTPHQFKVRVYRTGRVDICDAAKERSGDANGCA